MTVSAIYSLVLLSLLSAVINNNIMFYLIAWKTAKWDVILFVSKIRLLFW